MFQVSSLKTSIDIVSLKYMQKVITENKVKVNKGLTIVFTISY